MTNRTHTVLCMALSAGAALLTGCAGRVTLVEHAPVIDDSRVGLGFFSHTDPGARRDYYHADNFTLDADATINVIGWTGLVDGPEGAGLENVEGFEVRVLPFADRNPGAPVAVYRYRVDQTDPTPTGRLGSGENEASTAREFSHSVTLDPALDLEAGDYLLVIAADLLDPSASNWQWQDGETSDGFSASWSYQRARWEGVQDTDSAFELIGTPVR